MNYRLFQIGGVNIYTYGTLVAIAFLFGIFLAAYRARKIGEDPQNILDLCLYIMVSSIVGARLCFVVLNWEYFKRHLIEIVFIQQGGLVFYGGMIFAVACTIIFLKLKKLSILQYLDILTPSLAVGHAIGRVGCFFNGCCYGKVAGNSIFSFLAVRFPKVVERIPLGDGTISEQVIGSPPYIDHLYSAMITESDQYSLPIYPTQLFSAGMNFIFFFIMLAIFRHRKFTGQIWWSYLILYSVGRFMIEFVRADNPYVSSIPLTFSQILSIFLFITALTAYYFLSKQSKR
ncbi:MAG: prolipoprotein diacylglyceryl transferase [Candidatus Auribacterota bacterium]|jgi:phosphatidylglycerol:prolipoprotein diacylglycerol transferase|nr:prolipoprotein diacylglyceryl transferase [Candidatus Auribacterota bacterium]